MTKFYLVLISFLITINVSCFAQINSADLKRLHNTAAYKGSQEELFKVLAKNIRFPQRAVMSNKLVTIVGVLKIDRNGQIVEVGTLHKADENYTDAFKNIVEKTKGKWEATNDTAKYFYAVIPVQFNYMDSGYTLFETNKPAYFQETIVVTAAGTRGAFTGLYEKYESELIAQVNELSKKEVYSEAVKPMIELVNLQPLHIGYYDPLIGLLKKAGNNADAAHYEQVKALLSGQ
ncbi:hypothetical protein [Pontibacter populi]|uniref:TonB C-terminal domain-containing protein n=1 Tax=Pontibacter populi TaxID=890055 RepID=A0ABV1RRG9_9BACT